ncbi:MAG: hypothetical protein IT184_10115 [Acidobacteria bacterium]|nr:hypothetical protein [Acidobacteriota bacterium]
MTRRLLFVGWLAIGFAVWNGFFDLYVSRGARYYLQLQAEAELGRTSPAAMADVMARAARDGVIASSLWTVVIVGCGWATVALTDRARRPRDAAARRVT